MLPRHYHAIIYAIFAPEARCFSLLPRHSAFATIFSATPAYGTHASAATICHMPLRVRLISFSLRFMLRLPDALRVAAAADAFAR